MEKGVSLGIYLLINSLFVVKYLSRIAVSPVISVIVYVLLVACLLWLIRRWYNPSVEKGFSHDGTLSDVINPSVEKGHSPYLNNTTAVKSSATQEPSRLKWVYISLATFTVAAIITLHQLVDPYQLQVDRWSAIDHFLQRLLTGEYPYLAQTHLGGYGSPFPVWNIFHLPFFIAGNIAIGMTVMVLILVSSLKKLTGSYLHATIYLVLLVMSPAFWYEVAVRSDLIYNFILCFLLCGWWYKRDISAESSPWFTGIISGLILSTRLSVIIPFFIFLFSGVVKSGWKQRFQFVGSGAGVFILSFLPFIVWDADSLIFFEYNPFVLQTRQGSPYELIVLFSMLIPLSLMWKQNFSRFSFYTTLTVVTFVSVTFLHRMIIDDFNSGLFSSRYDITYFTMALPFVLYSVSNHLTEKIRPSEL